MKQVNLSEVLGIQDITEDCIVRGDGSVTIGFSLLLPPIYEQSSGRVWNMNKELNGVLNLLPSYATWHSQEYIYEKSFFTNSAESFTDKENTKYFTGRDILNHVVFVFITFPNRFFVKKNPGIIPVIGKYDWVRKQPFKKIEKVISQARRNRDKIYKALNAIDGIQAVKMDNEKLKKVVKSYLSLSYPLDEFQIDGNLSVPPIYKDENRLLIGDQYARIYTMTKEPDRLYNHQVPRGVSSDSFQSGISYEPRNLRTSQLFPITLGFPVNHVVNTTIQVIDKEDMFSYIRSNVKKPLNVFAVMKDEESMQVQGECDDYMSEIADKDYVPALLSLNVILHDSDEDKLKNNEDLLETAFSNLGGKVIPENVENLAKFKINTPGLADYNYDNFVSTTVQSSFYITKESNYTSDFKGFTFVDLFGKPVNIEIFDSEYINNRNGIIIAPSGGGKSVLLNNIVSQIMMGDGDVVVTDVGHSYVRNNYFEGGQYYDSSTREGFQFNPFLCMRDNDGSWLYRLNDIETGEEGEDHLNNLADIIFLIWKGEEGYTNNEWNIVIDSLYQFYEYANENKMWVNLIEYEKYLSIYEESVIKEQWKKFIDFDSLKLGLYPYVKGAKKYLLNSESNLNINDVRFVTFDLEAIKSSDIKDFKIISLIISNLVVQKIMATGKRVYFFNDEVQDFLEDKRMSRFIGYLFRTVRKKGGSIIVIGQNINFLKNAPKDVVDSILINCDIKMFLDHSTFTEAYGDLVKYGLLTQDEIKKLDNLVDGTKRGDRYKEFLLKLGNHSWILRNEFSPVSEMIYSTDSEDKKRIYKEFEKTGNMSLAVRKAAQLKYNYEK